MSHAFDRWRERLVVLVRDELGVPLEEILDVDERAMRAHWRAGHSPREFIDDHVVRSREDGEPPLLSEI